jgi:DNA-directed RNA polymerase subunit L
MKTLGNYHSNMIIEISYMLEHPESHYFNIYIYFCSGLGNQQESL